MRGLNVIQIRMGFPFEFGFFLMSFQGFFFLPLSPPAYSLRIHLFLYIFKVECFKPKCPYSCKAVKVSFVWSAIKNKNKIVSDIKRSSIRDTGILGRHAWFRVSGWVCVIGGAHLEVPIWCLSQFFFYCPPKSLVLYKLCAVKIFYFIMLIYYFYNADDLLMLIFFSLSVTFSLTIFVFLYG